MQKSALGATNALVLQNGKVKIVRVSHIINFAWIPMRNLMHCNLSLQAQVDFNVFESAVMIEFVPSIDKLSVNCINAI